MPSSVHFICRMDGERYKNLDRLEGSTYRSQAWAIPPRYAVHFDARREGRGQPWRGSRHALAWTSGPVPLSFTHETENA